MSRSNHVAINKTDSTDAYKSETSLILSPPLRQIDRRQAGPQLNRKV